MSKSRYEIAAGIEKAGFVRLGEIAGKVLDDSKLAREDLAYILRISETKERRLLFAFADALRKDFTGEMAFIKGVIEFSNYCRKNCAYCGIGAAMDIKRYRMTATEIIETAEQMAEMGVDTVILQSGEDPEYDIETLIHMVSEIKRRTRLPVSLSIGIRSKNDYERLKTAGASKVLLKHETASKEIFERVHPDDDYHVRIELLKHIVSIGYIGGSGNIIGLPGQTVEDIADDVIFLRDNGVKMVGLGPFIPASNTSLADLPSGDPGLTLNTYAAVRLSIPNVFMPSTTALGTLSEEKQFEGFRAGCNVIMCNFTPGCYRNSYSIYSDKLVVEFFKTARRLKKMGFKLNPVILKRLEERWD